MGMRQGKNSLKGDQMMLSTGSCLKGAIKKCLISYNNKMLTSCFDSEQKAAGDGFKLTDNSSK